MNATDFGRGYFFISSEALGPEPQPRLGGFDWEAFMFWYLRQLGSSQIAGLVLLLKVKPVVIFGVRGSHLPAHQVGEAHSGSVFL